MLQNLSNLVYIWFKPKIHAPLFSEDHFHISLQQVYLNCMIYVLLFAIVYFPYFSYLDVIAIVVSGLTPFIPLLPFFTFLFCLYYFSISALLYCTAILMSHHPVAPFANFCQLVSIHTPKFAEIHMN